MSQNVRQTPETLLPGSAAAAYLAAAVCLLAASLSPLGAQQQQAGPVFVDTLTVEGNVRQSASDILTTFGVVQGSGISYREIQAGLKRLWATGQFSDLQVTASGGAGAPVMLTVHVEEHDLVRRVEIRGLEHASPREAQDSSGLRAGEPYSPAKVARAKAFIREKLAREGIPFARIEEDRQPIPDREGEIQLVLDVEEGNRVTVAQVTFRGNEAFAESQLRGAMDTKPEGFWWFRSGSYDEQTREDDLRTRLPEFYRSNGYLDFRVLSDTLIVDPQTGKSRLELTVEEGPQYRLAAFEIEGNSRFPTSELERYFQAERGGLLRSLGFGGDEARGPPVFDLVAFEASAQQVGSLYRNQGYLRSSVEPSFERHPAQGTEPPTVTATWRIREGLPAFVNRIEVDGNDFTYERVVREQIFILPGDVYSEERLIQSYQAISALGFFETPMEFPTISEEPGTGDVNITFHVKEKQTGSINFGTAMGGGTGVSGFLGYDQPNLFGQAKSGSLRWDFGQFSNNFTLSFTDPALLQSRVSGSFSLFNSRDRFFQFFTGQRRRIGGSARFGLPVPGSLRTRLFVGYGLSRTRYQLRGNTDDTSLFGRPPGIQSTLSLSLVRSTLNHPLFPTVGSRQSLSSEFNGGILGGDAGFTKTNFEGTWYVPVGQVGGGSPGSRPIRFALGLSIKGGGIFGNAENFPFDRFWMGGVQFGQNLRGYEETTITPVGYFDRNSRGQIPEADRAGDAFLALTAEYAIRFNDNLSVSAFYDAGNVYRDPREIDPTRLFRGAGFGVQLVTPFGPLGLDYAYGFDKLNPGWQLHFRLGPGF